VENAPGAAHAKPAATMLRSAIIHHASRLYTLPSALEMAPPLVSADQAASSAAVRVRSQSRTFRTPFSIQEYDR
jgi:hypothetical protein